MNLWILDSSEPICRSGVHLHSHSASLRVLIIFCSLVEFFTYACVSNTSGFVFGHIVLKCSCKFMFLLNSIIWLNVQHCNMIVAFWVISSVSFVILFFWVSSMFGSLKFVDFVKLEAYFFFLISKIVYQKNPKGRLKYNGYRAPSS
jgi:hypothetical protein